MTSLELVFSNIFNYSPIFTIENSITNNSNYTITTLKIQNTNIVLFIIKDLTTNTYFFEVSKKLSNNLISSIAYNIQNNGSILGKIIFMDGKEESFLYVYNSLVCPQGGKYNNISNKCCINSICYNGSPALCKCLEGYFSNTKIDGTCECIKNINL
jgi:hypothetical protein